MCTPQDVKIIVLIADDDSDTREILKIALQLRKYTVIEVADGREMVARARQEKPNLIVADIMMPHIDGFEGVQMLREDPYFQSVPVLFISCIVSGEAIVNRMKEMPHCTFLEKPFDHNKLLQVMEKLIRTKRDTA